MSNPVDQLSALEVERAAVHARLYRFHQRLRHCIEKAEAAEQKYRDIEVRVRASKLEETRLHPNLIRHHNLEILVGREVAVDPDAQGAIGDNRFYISYATMYAEAIQAEIQIARQRGVLE